MRQKEGCLKQYSQINHTQQDKPRKLDFDLTC